MQSTHPCCWMFRVRMQLSLFHSPLICPHRFIPGSTISLLKQDYSLWGTALLQIVGNFSSLKVIPNTRSIKAQNIRHAYHGIVDETFTVSNAHMTYHVRILCKFVPLNVPHWHFCTLSLSWSFPLHQHEHCSCLIWFVTYFPLATNVTWENIPQNTVENSLPFNGRKAHALAKEYDKKAQRHKTLHWGPHEDTPTLRAREPRKNPRLPHISTINQGPQCTTLWHTF